MKQLLLIAIIIVAAIAQHIVPVLDIQHKDINVKDFIPLDEDSLLFIIENSATNTTELYTAAIPNFDNESIPINDEEDLENLKRVDLTQLVSKEEQRRLNFSIKGRDEYKLFAMYKLTFGIVLFLRIELSNVEDSMLVLLLSTDLDKCKVLYESKPHIVQDNIYLGNLDFRVALQASQPYMTFSWKGRVVLLDEFGSWEPVKEDDMHYSLVLAENSRFTRPAGIRKRTTGVNSNRYFLIRLQDMRPGYEKTKFVLLDVHRRLYSTTLDTDQAFEFHVSSVPNSNTYFTHIHQQWLDSTTGTLSNSIFQLEESKGVDQVEEICKFCFNKIYGITTYGNGNPVVIGRREKYSESKSFEVNAADLSVKDFQKKEWPALSPELWGKSVAWNDHGILIANQSSIGNSMNLFKENEIHGFIQDGIAIESNQLMLVSVLELPFYETYNDEPNPTLLVMDSCQHMREVMKIPQYTTIIHGVDEQDTIVSTKKRVFILRNLQEHLFGKESKVCEYTAETEMKYSFKRETGLHITIGVSAAVILIIIMVVIVRKCCPGYCKKCTKEDLDLSTNEVHQPTSSFSKQ